MPIASNKSSSGHTNSYCNLTRKRDNNVPLPLRDARLPLHGRQLRLNGSRPPLRGRRLRLNGSRLPLRGRHLLLVVNTYCWEEQ